jgi:predicted PurR-regulated permease PerM
VLIGVLGIASLVALWPFLSGIMGAAVLFVTCRPLFRWLAGRMPERIAATVVVTTAVVVLLAPSFVLAGFIASETQALAEQLSERPVFGRLAVLRFGPFEIGPYILRAGEGVVDWIGSSALDLVRRAARGIINVVIAMFGLFYLLLRSRDMWTEIETFLPFSSETTARLLRRFHDLTLSTLVGTGLTALAQGTLVGIAFTVVGVASPLFWAVITAIFSTIPFVGSVFVWGPAVIALVALDRFGAAVGIALWGAVVVASADNIIRPLVYARWARIHPMVTVLGVVAGVRFFGVLGVLLGPMALSYLLEFVRIYRDEYEALDRTVEIVPTHGVQ